MRGIAFGDSITQGVYIEKTKTFCEIVERSSGFSILNLGVPGNNTDEALERFGDVTLVDGDFILIQFGMNDHYLVKEATHNVSPLRFKANIAKIVSESLALDLKVFVMTIHPVIEDLYYLRHDRDLYRKYNGANQLIDDYNVLLRECAQKAGAALIDISTCFKKAVSSGDFLEDLLISLQNSSQKDGVHLALSGHKLYADAILESFQKEGLIDKHFLGGE